VAGVAHVAQRDALRPPCRVRPYPWGALWFIGDRGDLAPDMLDQVVEGTRFLAGVVPTGPTQASLFFSVPAARPRDCLAGGLDAWRATLERHPAAAAPATQITGPGQLQEARYLDLAAPRDLLLGPAARIPVVGRQMVRTMAGLMPRTPPET
jgi:hypothetical protein